MATRPNMTDLAGTALVTGASSGIGAATTRLLCWHGVTVAAQSRGGQALRELADGTGAYPCTADLTAPQAPAALYEEVTGAIGPVDLLVCNAGAGWEGPVESMPADRVDELVELNLSANLRLVRSFVPEMLRRERGHIVLVSSIAGSMGVPGEAVYSATKAALRVFGDAVRLELAPGGVGVTVVNPGAVRTAFFERRGSPYRRSIPRQVPATDVARAIVRAVRRGQQEVFVPRWLRLAARLQGAAPGPIGTLRRALS